LCAAIIVICLSAFAVFKILSPEIKEEQVTLYSYSMTVGGDYKVYLKANEIYNEMYMGEKMIYPKSIFDKLSVNFSAKFSGSSGTVSDIKADYSIEVLVRGFQMKGEEKRILYEKTFPLFEQAGMKYRNIATISREISLDFTQYESYINNVKSIISADPNSEALLMFSGNFKAETEFGEKEEQFTYAIALPLFESLFTIDKPAAVEKTGSITEMEVIKTYAEKILLIIPGSVIFIMLLLIVYMMIYTIPPTDEEKLVLRFKSIMRKHGSRVVRLSRFLGSSWETILVIKDIEGMIKISDECNIPIFYIPDEKGMPEEYSMFIPGKDICYTYYITESKIPIFRRSTT
jgi:hypothetical protein